MGFLKDLIAAKEEVWQGEDFNLYEENCKKLKTAGLKVQAFKINTDIDGCTGECASCSTCMTLNIEARSEEEKTVTPDRYAIYVKQTDAKKARELLGEAV